MNTTEAEVLDATTALVVREQEPVSVTLFGASEPHEIVTRATSVADALKAVLKKQGLISNIGGKEYPRCEAWTLLGTMLGVFPVLCWTKQIDNGWEARVEARTRDGSVIGAAEAECLRSERNWSNREDFALRSMAQTRATAKALRMPLGFVMTLAGYEATPAEEMQYDRAPAQQKAQRNPEPPKSRTEDEAEAAMGQALDHYAEGQQKATGTLEQLASKPTKKGGTRYGVMLDGERWFNHFDGKVQEDCESLKGHRVIVHYVETQYGKDLKSIDPEDA